MTVHVTSWVLRNSKATLGSRLVLLVLADYADEDGGNCWPSVATIARETLLSERQVQYALRNLESLGELEVQQGGGRRSNRYRVLMGGVQNLHPLSNGRGATHFTPAVQPTAPDPPVDPPIEQLPAAEPRKRNEIWDALSVIFGEPTTRPAQRERGQIVRDLTEAGATPEDIFARSKRWAKHFDHATLTAHALVKHWDTLPLTPRRVPR